jgi:membrane protease YdiL (CAAX protease family)
MTPDATLAAAPAARASARTAPSSPWAFFALACLFSWLDWGLVIASARGWMPWRVGPNSWGSFGPALAALVLAWRAGGGASVRALLAPMVRVRVGWPNAALALLGPFVLVGAAVALSVAFGQPLGPVQMPDPLETVVLALAIFVIGGPLGEEIGWRGHALPQLLRTHSPALASLLVAAMWAVWHLPLFWMPGAAQEGSSIPGFVALLSAFSVLTTWLWLRGGGSLALAMAFHWSINVSTYLLPGVLPGVADSKAFSWSLLALGVSAGLVAWGRLRRVHAPG